MSPLPRLSMALALCCALHACARNGLEAAEIEGGPLPPAMDSGQAPADDAGVIKPADGGTDAAVADSGPILWGDAGSSDASVPLDAGQDAAIDSGSVDSGADAGILDAGPEPEDDSGPMFVCTSTSGCSSARSLSTIRGDSEAQVSSASGNLSEWVAVTIADIGGVFNADNTLRARITLTSPVGSNYDLFVHRPDEAGGNATPPKDCSVPPLSSQAMTGDDVVAVSWQDVPNFFGETAGDGLTLSIEIRHVSGPCDKMWSLSVQGNAL